MSTRERQAEQPHPRRTLTADQAVQGLEKNVDRVVEYTEPSSFDTARRGVQHVLGVFFPWMQPGRPVE